MFWLNIEPGGRSLRRDQRTRLTGNNIGPIVMFLLPCARANTCTSWSLCNCRRELRFLVKRHTAAHLCSMSDMQALTDASFHLHRSVSFMFSRSKCWIGGNSEGCVDQAKPQRSRTALQVVWNSYFWRDRVETDKDSYRRAAEIRRELSYSWGIVDM